jgi:hypothetical protein
MTRRSVAKPKDKQPWFKFYPQDWRGDAKLRMCSIGARGLWAEMLCVMHESEPYGYLTISGKTVTSRQLAALAGVSQGECMKYMLELASAGVYSIDDDKTIYSRRMVRDKAKAEKDRENGKGGGNPTLKGEDKRGVNPQDNGVDKAQKPYSKNQSPEAATEARALDEIGLRNEAVLTAQFTALCKSLYRDPPDLRPIRTWLLDGIAIGTIAAAATPILKRKDDMVSLAYCDSAVREAHGKASSSGPQIVSIQEFIVEGTLEWSCWERYLHETTGRGSPVTDNRDSEGRLRRGWFRPTRFPPGYDEATGEKLAPKSDDEVAA